MIDYSKIKAQKISKDLEDLLNKNKFYSILEDLEFSKSQVITVQSPFILADNCYDLHEANNTLEEINVKRTNVVQFTGGSFYIVYEKTGDDAYVIHGNSEQGFNIFNLI